MRPNWTEFFDLGGESPSLREIKTPRKVDDILKPKSENKEKNDRFHKLFCEIGRFFVVFRKLLTLRKRRSKLCSSINYNAKSILERRTRFLNGVNVFNEGESLFS